MRDTCTTRTSQRILKNASKSWFIHMHEHLLRIQMVSEFAWRMKCYGGKGGEWHVCPETKDMRFETCAKSRIFSENLKVSPPNPGLGTFHGWCPFPALFIHPVIFNVCFESWAYGWRGAHKTEVQALNWYDITPIAF